MLEEAAKEGNPDDYKMKLSAPVVSLQRNSEVVQEEIPHQTYETPLELAVKLFHQEEAQRGTFGPIHSPLVSPREIISHVQSIHSTRNSLHIDEDEEHREHGVPLSLILLEFSDPEFREIEAYGRILVEEEKRWEKILESDDITVKSMPNSKFSNESPVYLFSLSFPPSIPSDFLLDCLDDWEFRSQWDSKVLKMNKLYSEIGNFFTHYHIFCIEKDINRSFLLKFALRVIGKNTIFVFKSVASTAKVEETEEIVRGKVQFGYIRIEKGEKRTTLTCVFQFLLYLEESLIEEEMSAALLGWLEDYKRSAVRLYKEEIHR